MRLERKETLKSASIHWLITLGLFLLALWLRTDQLTHFITADEHNWVFRSGVFLAALLERNWAATNVWLTPAVTTTWLGSAGLVYHYWSHQAEINQPLVNWLTTIPRNRIDLDILLAMRWAMALFSTTMLTVIYHLARRLWGWPIALLGTLFLITEPHLLAVSRIIGHDAPITLFTMGAILAYFQARRNIKLSQAYLRWFILSGLGAGLAVLSKTPALFLIPFTGLICLSEVLVNGVNLKRWGVGWLTWLATLWLTFILCWPAAWVSPLKISWAVTHNAFLSSAGAEDPDLQPFYQVPNLGYFYYLVNGAFKLSPWLSVGLLLAVWGWWQMSRRAKNPKRTIPAGELTWLILFALLFGIMLTLGVKKSPRYILPAFPPIAFMAAWGWLSATRLTKPAGAVIFLGLLSLMLTLVYRPYYFTYFNPLLGGPLTAPHLVRVGWGEGLDDLARQLNAQPEAHVKKLGVRYTATIRPFYEGEIASPVSAGLDYVAFYLKQSQSGYPTPEILAYFSPQKPLYQVYLAGINYAQVYPGPAMQLIDSSDQSSLPIAFRPNKIYAPIGGQLTIDLLWPADLAATKLAQTIILHLHSTDETLSLKAAAPIEISAAQVAVSQHHFTLLDSLPREDLILTLDDQPIGQIAARRLQAPANWQPLDQTIDQQLKLIAIQQQHQADQLLVQLAWQAWPEANHNYTAFVQLLNQQGERIAGVDIAPGLGFSQLDRKEIMLATYPLSLSADVISGRYHLLIGLYYFAGEQLINIGTVTLEDAVRIE